MQSETFDVAVIGAGPGGYVAAIKCAQQGKKTCLIEKNFLGGTCLNVGCIPTKTLLASAFVLEQVLSASHFGISCGSVSFDYGKMKERKDQVIAHIRKSLEGLITSNHITILKGAAEYLSPTEIKVKGEDNLHVTCQHSIIATGSEPLDIAAFPCDHTRIYNSTSILERSALPKSIAIIGGGYIGCEFASLYAELGVKVTILEALPSIIITQGKAVADALTRAFQKKGIDIQTNVFVEGIDSTATNVKIRLKDKQAIEAEIALVSVGRKVLSTGLGLEKAGVLIGEKGEILVDERMQTNVPGIYAIGDVTAKAMLAHVASHQGVIAALNVCNQPARMDYLAVPAVIFTTPEIATVGMTSEQAEAAGRSVACGKFPFMALGKAIASRDTEGFAQILSDKKTGEILGAQIVGRDAANLIAELTLAMQHELTTESIAETIHAHPTMAEAWAEAALIARGEPIHFPPKR